MPNKVQITVTVNGSAVPAQLAAINAATKASTDRQKSMWDTLGARAGETFKGIGVIAAGALGVGLTGPLAAAGLAVGAFGAIAAPTLSKVEKALTSTGKAGQTAWANLDPGQRNLADSIKGLETQFDGLAQQMEPVVTNVLDMASHTADDLMPAVGALAGAGAKVIGDFLTPMNRLLGSPFFKNFTDQMSSLATQIGPVLGDTLASILKSLMQMFEQAGPSAVKIFKVLLPLIAQTVQGLVPVVAGVTDLVSWLVQLTDKSGAGKVALAGLAGALLGLLAGGLLGAVIGAIAALAGYLVHLWETSQTFRNIVTTVFADVGKVALTFAEMWLTEMQVVSNIFLDTVGTIVHGAADAFGWVPWAGGKLRDAASAFDRFKSGVNDTFNAAHSKIEGWKTDLTNMPKIVALKGDITDLQAKLASAEQQLKNPDLTKTRRARIEANIAQLEAQVAAAKAQLASIQGKTVTITTIMQQIDPGSSGGGVGVRKASGGIVGAAGGGPRSNLVMVGEHGREVVSLPSGSTVHSNPDTERMLGQGGGLHITLELGPSFQKAGLTQQQLEDIRYTVRTVGGGNVQEALGVS